MTTATHIKDDIYWGWLTGPEVQSIIIMAGSMVESRQTWCWRRSQEFYIWICRQQEERDRGRGNWAWFEFLKPQSHPTRPYFLIVPLPVSLWGAFSFKTTTVTKGCTVGVSYLD